MRDLAPVAPCRQARGIASRSSAGLTSLHGRAGNLGDMASLRSCCGVGSVGPDFGLCARRRSLRRRPAGSALYCAGGFPVLSGCSQHRAGAALVEGTDLAMARQTTTSLGARLRRADAIAPRGTGYQRGLFRPRPASELVGGGIVYALVALMALTSNDAAQQRMGRWWRRLHWLGVTAVLLTFTQSYVLRLFEPDYFWTGAIFAPLALLALAIRLFEPWRKHLFA